MSMRIQDALSNCCQEIGNFASAAANAAANAASNVAEWLGKTISVISAHVADYAQKAAEFAQPHIENLKNFVSENRGPIVIAAAAATLGAIAYALISSVFCKNTAAVPPPAQV